MAVVAVAVGAISAVPLAEPAGAAPGPGYLTLMFGRAQWTSTEGCTPMPNTVDLGMVAANLSSRGIPATGTVVTAPTQETADTCLKDIGTYASWSKLAQLRDQHGWTFVSTGTRHGDMTAMTPQGQYDESCGSLTALQAHGHNKASSLFGFPNDKYTTQIMQDVVSTCFSYGRTYVKPGWSAFNSRGAMKPPWLQSTTSVNGGACNNASLPCYDPANVGTSRRYNGIPYLSALLKPGADQWGVVQFYRFVTGAYSGPASRWDCSSPNWQDHWTSKAELYCYDDFLAATSQIPSNVVVTDPSTVAAAWNRPPGGGPDTVPPNGSIGAPTPDQELPGGTASVAGTATDNIGVTSVQVSIKNRADGNFLLADGTWGTTQAWLPGVLDSPGNSEVSWTYGFTPPGPGDWAAEARAVDATGNVDPTRPYVRFTTTTAPPPGIPTYTSTLGGPLHAEILPSGLAIAPDGAVVVADTGNNRVKKLTSAGVLVWEVGTFGPGVGEFDKPRDVAVDSFGNVFVADTRNSRLVKLGSNGAWLGAFTGPAALPVNFPLGLSIRADKVYLADTGRKRVLVLDTAGNQLAALSANGACGSLEAIRDVDADSAGNVYIAGYKTNTIIKFAPDGTCLQTWGSQGSGNGQFRTPYGVAVEFDPVLGAEAVFVADALNNRLQEFRTDGTFVTVIGGPGTAAQPGTFTNLRRAATATDGSGDVWGADLWGGRVERFRRTATGYAFAQSIGTPLPATTDNAVFHEPRSVAFAANGDLQVTDTVHHRIVRMTPDGHVLGSCGRRGSALGEFNWPRGADVDHATGQIWIADTNQNRLQVINPDCSSVRSVGKYGTDLAGLNWPYAITIRQSDRVAWVADNQNNRIKSYNVATGQPIASVSLLGGQLGKLSKPSGIAVDPATGHIFVADTGNNRIVELSDTGGGSIQAVRAIKGQLKAPEGVAIAKDGSGRIFVADTGNHQAAAFSAAGALMGRISGPDGVTYPSAVNTTPDGKVLVSDTYGDRVQVFGGSASDTTPPDGTLSTPTAGQALPNGPVSFSGAASDNSGVAAVKIAIKDRSSGFWWQPTGGFASAYRTLETILGSPGSGTTTWALTWEPPGAGSYGVSVIAVDGAGNADPSKPWTQFTVA